MGHLPHNIPDDLTIAKWAATVCLRSSSSETDVMSISLNDEGSSPRRWNCLVVAICEDATDKTRRALDTKTVETAKRHHTGISTIFKASRGERFIVDSVTQGGAGHDDFSGAVPSRGR